MAAAYGKLVVEPGGWYPGRNSRTRTMPRYPLMNLILADYQEDARDQTNGGGSSRDLAIPRGRSLNAVLLPTGLWVRLSIFSRRKIIPQSSAAGVRWLRGGWQGIWIAAASGALR